MARGRHTEWPEGAWIDSRTGETHAGLEDHAEFAADHPSTFGLDDEDIRLLRSKGMRDKSEFLRRIVRKGWIRARGQYFDVPSLGEGVLMDVCLYAREAGVHPDEMVYIKEVDTGRGITCRVEEIEAQAEVAQPVESTEAGPKECEVFVGLQSARLKKRFKPFDVTPVVAAHIQGASFLSAVGLWKGQTEPSVVIRWLNLDKLSEEEVEDLIGTMAEDLAYQFGQDVVLVAYHYDDMVRFESYEYRARKYVRNPYWFEE